MRADIASLALDYAYTALGVAGCSYQPNVGPATDDLTLMILRPDRRSGFESQVITETTTIRVRVAELAAPTKDGVFTAGAESFRVIAKPERTDRLGLEWSMPVEPA